MLKAGFRPILKIKDGRIKTEKIHRERNKAKALFSEFRKEIAVILSETKNPLRSFAKPDLAQNDIRVAITHADCESDANALKKLVQNYNKNIKIEFVNTISPVVGAHLGPDSLIISWIVE